MWPAAQHLSGRRGGTPAYAGPSCMASCTPRQTTGRRWQETELELTQTCCCSGHAAHVLKANRARNNGWLEASVQDQTVGGMLPCHCPHPPLFLEVAVLIYLYAFPALSWPAQFLVFSILFSPRLLRLYNNRCFVDRSCPSFNPPFHFPYLPGCCCIQPTQVVIPPSRISHDLVYFQHTEL